MLDPLGLILVICGHHISPSRLHKGPFRPRISLFRPHIGHLQGLFFPTGPTLAEWAHIGDIQASYWFPSTLGHLQALQDLYGSNKPIGLLGNYKPHIGPFCFTIHPYRSSTGP